MKESELVDIVRSSIEMYYKDAVIYKMHGNEYMELGLPDLIGCIEGVMVAFELKVNTPLKPMQHQQLRRLVTAGASVAVIIYDVKTKSFYHIPGPTIPDVQGFTGRVRGYWARISHKQINGEYILAIPEVLRAAAAV